MTGSISRKNAAALMVDDEENIEEHQYLTFVINQEAYGITILAIKEILEYGELTRIPMVPSFIRGVINLRGSVVPVVDLAVRMGAESAQVTKRTCIVIIEITHEDEVMDIGIVVDAVNEVLDIPPEEVEPAPNFGASIRLDFIRGMGKVNNKFVILLDVNRVLSVEELSLLDGAVKSGTGA